jgi:hypothetical protein
MSITIWRVFRALAGLESGSWCRRCTESIHAADPFGISEGVCRGCRGGG